METIKESLSIPQINVDPSVGWNIEPNYVFTNSIGCGSYGTVCSAVCLKTQTQVAIKKFSNIYSDPMRCRRILREVELLYEMNHPCIVRPLDVFMRQESDLYLVMEIGKVDLSNLRNSIFLVDSQVRMIMYKLLVALNYIHSGGIINRDVKPANILVDTDCSVKLCDFNLGRCITGLASSVELPSGQTPVQTELLENTESDDEIDEGYMGVPQTVYCKFEVKLEKTRTHKRAITEPEEITEKSIAFLRSKQKEQTERLLTVKPQVHDPQLSGYIATRWYRPPEVILLEKAYTTSVDIWGAGCVFAELLEMVKENLKSIDKRSALFPGQSCFPLSPSMNYGPDAGIPCTPQDQLKTILEIFGKPSLSDLSFLKDKKTEEYVEALSSTGHKMNFKEKFPASDDDTIDLLKKMLAFNPFHRITAHDALRHPYFKNIRERSLETEMKKHVVLLTDRLKVTTLKELVNQVLKKAINGVKIFP